ncbi:MAG: nucleotidyltransferase family protein [Aliarcobacter sp.]|nr:nucleotidyltransferase family protein [Aliarcobacter sp.]
MKALLLSAGLGTRLRPLTDTMPKCLVPINGKPLLQIWLENLTKCGVKEFLINTHYLREQVEEFVNNSIFKERITLIYEEELLHTGGTLLKNKNFFTENESFLLVHADNYSICDFAEFINIHKKYKDCPITMMLFKTDNPKSCGIVELNKENIAIAFHEKVEYPPSDLANGAVYICKYEIFEYLENLNKEFIDFSNEVIPNYLGKISTYLNEIYHRDIGTIESYKKAQLDSLRFTEK